MNKTISERATIAGQAYQFGKTGIESDAKVFERGYIQGAEEQHKIDIEKAVRWLDDNINNYLFNDNSFGSRRDWLKCSSQAFVDFRKAMEQ